MNKPKLEPCPFCGGEARLKGRGYSTDDYRVYCIECGCSTPLWSQTVAKAMEIWSRRTTPDNKALTVEELREMDGQPVWIVAHPDWGHWELSECAEDYFEDRDEDFYGMTMPPTLPDPMGRYGLHMMGWLAYRRPPENGGVDDETRVYS